MDSSQLTPLRWAGSKKRLLRLLGARSPRKYLRYIEPFAGSAVLFYHLKPRMALLADVNSDLIAFYRSLRRSPESLYSQIAEVEVSRPAYLKVRSAFQEASGEQRSAYFWYLNRCCFNGIYRTNQKGEFNVPFGSKLPPMPSLQAAKDGNPPHFWTRSGESFEIGVSRRSLYSRGCRSSER